MPTYEFRCPSGHDFEKFYRSIGTAVAVVPCPSCGKIAERQLSAGAGLLFKGSGFYITDYGKDGKKPQGQPAVAGEKQSDGSSDAVAAKGEAAGEAKSHPEASAGGASAKETAATKAVSDKPAKSKPAKKPAATE